MLVVPWLDCSANTKRVVQLGLEHKLVDDTEHSDNRAEDRRRGHHGCYCCCE